MNFEPNIFWLISMTLFILSALCVITAAQVRKGGGITASTDPLQELHDAANSVIQSARDDWRTKPYTHPSEKFPIYRDIMSKGIADFVQEIEKENEAQGVAMAPDMVMRLANSRLRQHISTTPPDVAMVAEAFKSADLSAGIPIDRARDKHLLFSRLARGVSQRREACARQMLADGLTPGDGWMIAERPLVLDGKFYFDCKPYNPNQGALTWPL